MLINNTLYHSEEALFNPIQQIFCSSWLSLDKITRKKLYFFAGCVNLSSLQILGKYPFPLKKGYDNDIPKIILFPFLGFFTSIYITTTNNIRMPYFSGVKCRYYILLI